jgi:hypothetical protein
MFPPIAAASFISVVQSPRSPSSRQDRLTRPDDVRRHLWRER